MINKINLLIAISNKLALKLSYDEGEKCKTKTKKGRKIAIQHNARVSLQTVLSSKSQIKIARMTISLNSSILISPLRWQTLVASP